MKKSNNTKKSANALVLSANGRIAAQVQDDITKTGMTWGYALVPIKETIRNMAYQRPTEESRVNKIIREFDWDKVDPKCVNYRPEEDKFAVMDGLHTLTALEIMGKEFIPCKVFINKTYEQEAAMFAAQNKGIKKITSVDEFRALVEAKDPDAITIMKVMSNYGVELAPVAGFKKCRSVRKLTKIMSTIHEEGLRFVFQLIEDANWGDDGKAYTEGALNVGFYAYPQLLKKNGKLNKTKYNYLLKILRKYKTSTQYVDVANIEFSETTTRHPQDAVKKLIERDLEAVQVEYQRMVDYQRDYKTRGSVVRVENIED